MRTGLIFSILILVVGVVLLGFGINSSQAVANQATEGVIGRFTSTTMAYIIGGVAMVIGGILGCIRSRK